RRLGRDGGCGGRWRRSRGRRFGSRRSRRGRRGFLLLENAAEDLAENAHSPAPERDEALSANKARAGSVKLERRRRCRGRRAQAASDRVTSDSALKTAHKKSAQAVSARGANIAP